VNRSEKRAAEIVKNLRADGIEPLAKILKDGVISKQEFKRLFGLLADAFDELLNDTPNTKRMERKIRELIMGLFDINYDGEISDEGLRTAVKLIRERIVGRSQRESLARLIAEELVENWTSADSEQIEEVAGDGGLIEQLTDKIDDGPDFDDGELLELMIDLGGIIAARYASRLSDADADSILERGVEVARGIEEKKNIGDPLLELANDGLRKLGVVSLMRRAFSGLLIGDLILRQVGKSLNIKGNVSVTDFIIYVGVKVFESEGVREADPEQVSRVREALEAARAV